MAYERKGGKKSGDFGSTRKTENSFRGEGKKTYSKKSDDKFKSDQKPRSSGRPDFAKSGKPFTENRFKKEGFSESKSGYKKTQDKTEFGADRKFSSKSDFGEKKRSYIPKDFNSDQSTGFGNKRSNYSKTNKDSFSKPQNKGKKSDFDTDDFDSNFQIPRKFSKSDAEDFSEKKSKQKEAFKPSGVTRAKAGGGYPKSLNEKFASKKRSLSEKEPDKPENNGFKKTSYKPLNDKKSGKNTAFGKEDKSGKEKRFGSDFKRKERSFDKKKTGKTQSEDSDGMIRLNRYIAAGGMCSRREADVYISEGLVRVNGVIVTEMGYKVKPGDVVKFDDQTIKPEKNVYLLLNKPKDYITTSEDPNGRKTVMQLVKGACKERLYPVGRLDRNTTGLLLMTNDGQLADKLMHPRKKVRKIYHAELDKPFKSEHLETLKNGIELEDGFMKPDVVEYTTAVNGDKKQVGIEIHSGKNRIVRRMFEHFGYVVVKLDRVIYAGLTKKNLPRGHWRMLEEHELNILKML